MNDFELTNLFLALLGVLNLITFLVFGFDKLIAGGRARRVPEKVLWLLSVLGGSVGGLLGMFVFHHKTRKLSFQLVMAGIFLIQMILIVLVSRYVAF